MSPSAPEHPGPEMRFPRVSGDEPPMVPGNRADDSFSPRERG